jgi:chemotaxis protein MotB
MAGKGRGGEWMRSSIRPAPEGVRNQISARTKGRALPLRKRELPGDTGNEIWLLTLSDLLILLLIFFSLYFGLTFQRQSQAAPIAPQQTRPATQVPPPATPQPLPRESTPDPAPAEVNTSLEKDLKAMLGENPEKQGVSVERRDRFVVVTLPEPFLFDSGRSELKDSARPLLDKVAVFIKDHPEISTEVQGHTDDRPIRNQRYPSNWELSADRAAQVARSLIQTGIQPELLSIKGFGEHRPLYANDGESNRMKNRRVEIQFSTSMQQ